MEGGDIKHELLWFQTNMVYLQIVADIPLIDEWSIFGPTHIHYTDLLTYLHVVLQLLVGYVPSALGTYSVRVGGPQP